jgi:uncharacterized Zn finger protein (UPF0148 family)
MKLYCHYGDSTVIIRWENNNGSIKDLRKQFLDAFNKKNASSPLSEEDLVVANERRQAFPADEKTSRIFKDGDDVYFTLKGDVRKESNNTSLPVVSATMSQQRPQNKYSTPQYSAPVSTPSHVNPSPSHEATPSMDSYIDEDLDEPDSRPMYSESQPYGRKKQLVLVDELPAEEALSTSCCICGEMLQYKRKDKSVQCHYCKGINLPVTVVDAQAECSVCKRAVFRKKGERCMRCDCGFKLNVIQCIQCKTPFVAPDGLPSMPCPSCGTQLSSEHTVRGSPLMLNLLVNREVNEPEEWWQKEAKPKEKNKPLKITLVVQYYEETNEDRRKELMQCIENNLQNRYIDNIYFFLENDVDVAQLFGNNPKIIKGTVLGRRLKYSEAIDFCNTELKGQICILANLDVYFDHTLRELIRGYIDGKFLALSRHDVTSKGTIQFNEWVSPISQDAWIFKSPMIKPHANKELNINFPLGYPGCDNRVAWEFRNIGLHVINPGLKIIVRHLHASEKRNYSDENKVTGNYAAVTPSLDL